MKICKKNLPEIIERFKKSRKMEEEKVELNEKGEKIVYYNPEHHIFIEDAKRIKKDARASRQKTCWNAARTGFSCARKT